MQIVIFAVLLFYKMRISLIIYKIISEVARDVCFFVLVIMHTISSMVFLVNPLLSGFVGCCCCF